MQNLKEVIQQFKGKDAALYLALDKFVKEIEEQDRRIGVTEKLIDSIQKYSTGCFITQQNSQNLTTGAWTIVNFGTEIFDGDNLHNNSFSQASIKVKNSGFYLILACLNVLNTNVDNAIRLVISAGQVATIHGTAHSGLGHVVGVVREMAANSDVHVEFFTSAVGNQVAPGNPNYFGLYRLPFDTMNDLSGVFI